MRRANRGKKPLLNSELKCVILLATRERSETFAKKKEDKQLNRINEFVRKNNLVPMKIYRTGTMGNAGTNENFHKALTFMQAGKADAMVAVNMDAISVGIMDAYNKIGRVRACGLRIFSVDEKELGMQLYCPPGKAEGE